MFSVGTSLDFVSIDHCGHSTGGVSMFIFGFQTCFRGLLLQLDVARVVRAVATEVMASV